MMESNFIDYVKICCRSGKGGRGSTHMRRVKYNPNGGPDGGNGGRGGHIILRGNRNYWTLLHLRYDRHIFAGNGQNGSRNKSTGADGADRIIEVPCGTVAYNAETGEYLCDITDDGQEVILLRGGRGGLGNYNFCTPTRQAPRFAQPGEPMQEMMVILELKLLADVGLVGFPNAGKSTLLASISAAKPKIANYPFTTMEPNLGIVSYREGKSFVMADIPGIIEGASEGKGLGLRFLRHIERNSVLLFMIPGDTDSIRHEYEILLSELATFNPDMLSKERVLAITKCDLLDDELISLLEPELPTDIPHIFISAVTGFGVSELKDILWQVLNNTSTRISIAGGDATEVLVHRNISKEDLDEINAAEGDLFVPDAEEEYEELEDFEYEFDEDDEDSFNDK
ncbi:MAG: GTPase ObgE [Bacteroidaceae bacterium]|nr:GTPase ObgE [Bacteroidaceae bacterium]